MIREWLFSSSLRSRLTRLNLIACAASVFVASCLYFAFDFVSVRTAMKEALSVQAQIVAANSVAALTFDDADAAKRTLSALKSSPRILCARRTGAMAGAAPTSAIPCPKLPR